MTYAQCIELVGTRTSFSATPWTIATAFHQWTHWGSSEQSRCSTADGASCAVVLSEQ